MSVPSQQGDTPLGSPGQKNLPSNANFNQILHTYFQKKGYNQNELAFIQQQKISSEHNVVSLEQLSKKFIKTTPTSVSETQLPNYIKLIKQNPELNGGDLDASVQQYECLREWIYNALDLYKTELRSVLYPIFVHTFLDLMSKGLLQYGLDFFQKYKSDHQENHTTDLDALALIQSTDDVKHNRIAKLYLEHKYNIRMSSIPFELFLHYIQDKKHMHLIRVVNQYFNIHIATSKLAPASAGGAVEEGIAGHMNDQIEVFHENTLVQLDTKKYDEDQEMDTPIQKIKQESWFDTMDLDEMVGLSYRGTDIQAELDSLSDLRKRVSLGSAALPSVCIYTFHNTHHMLNCITISEDITLVAAGFSESFIKVWHLKGQLLQSKYEKDANQSGTKYKKLIGHAGPVYGVSFSHDNQYLISCSEDQTVRLWSLDTYTNLVCYKSHNYPIWDVEFGPYGFYFATASHDKTARLWSCDHINPLRIFAGHLSDVNVVRFHPNSKYVVTGSSDKTARLWDVQRGTCVRVFTGHTAPVHTVAVSSNGRLMASGGEDRTLIVWDLGTGKRLKTMTGHTGFIYSVSFNSDSTVLVSGSADGTVRVWDVNKNTPYDHSNNEPDTKRAKYDKINGKQQKDKKEMEKAKSVADSISKRKKGALESNDHLSAFPTKNTPIYTVQFTRRNLCLAAGTLNPPTLDL